MMAWCVLGAVWASPLEDTLRLNEALRDGDAAFIERHIDPDLRYERVPLAKAWALDPSYWGRSLAPDSCQVQSARVLRASVLLVEQCGKRERHTTVDTTAEPKLTDLEWVDSSKRSRSDAPPPMLHRRMNLALRTPGYRLVEILRETTVEPDAGWSTTPPACIPEGWRQNSKQWIQRGDEAGGFLTEDAGDVDVSRTGSYPSDPLGPAPSTMTSGAGQTHRCPRSGSKSFWSGFLGS